MTEWTVVLVLSTLVGLFAVFLKPVITLTQTITKLTLSVDALQTTSEKSIKEQRELSHRVESQDEVLDDHEHRITVLEKGA